LLGDLVKRFSYLIREKATKPMSIRSKLLVSIISLLFVVITAIGLFVIKRSYSDLTSSLISKSVSLARTVSIQASNNIGFNRLFEILKLLNDIVNNDRELAYGIMENTTGKWDKPLIQHDIRILKKKGHVKFVSAPSIESKKNMSLGNLKTHYVVKRGIMTSSGLSHEILEVTYPVFVGGDQWGWLRLGLTTQYLQQKVEHTLWMLSLALVVFVILGVGGGLVIARQFAAPVQHLSGFADLLAQRDFSQSIASTRRDELGRLTRAFDSMRGNVRELVEEIRQSGEALAGSSVELSETTQVFSDNTMNQASST
jgi:methyl-accepting chemotaxis protein